jgi:hypothetical protein
MLGEKGKEAAKKEMLQLNERDVFEPVHETLLNHLEKKRALESLIFLT